MRKIFALMLIAGSLAAGVSTAFAMEREQLVGHGRYLTTVGVTDGAATFGSASSAWTGQRDHDLK